MEGKLLHLDWINKERIYTDEENFCLLKYDEIDFKVDILDLVNLQFQTLSADDLKHLANGYS